MPRTGWRKPGFDRRLPDLASVGLLTRVFPANVVDEVIAAAGVRKHGIGCVGAGDRRTSRSGWLCTWRAPVRTCLDSRRMGCPGPRAGRTRGRLRRSRRSSRTGHACILAGRAPPGRDRRDGPGLGGHPRQRWVLRSPRLRSGWEARVPAGADGRVGGMQNLCRARPGPGFRRGSPAHRLPPDREGRFSPFAILSEPSLPGSRVLRVAKRLNHARRSAQTLASSSASPPMASETRIPHPLAGTPAQTGN